MDNGCGQSLTVSVTDTRYDPAVISNALLFRDSTFIDEFSMKKLLWLVFHVKISVIIEKFKQKGPFSVIYSLTDMNPIFLHT